MATNRTEQELLNRLRELERENSRLREVAQKSGTPIPLVVTEGDYKGHPTLSFEGPCRRFALGLRKLRIIQQGWSEVEAFLARHQNASTGNEPDGALEQI